MPCAIKHNRSKPLSTFALMFVCAMVTGCAQGNGVHETRLGKFPLKSIGEEKTTQYDGTQHTLQTTVGGLSVYCPSEPVVIPSQYEIVDGNTTQRFYAQGLHRYILSGEN